MKSKICKISLFSTILACVATMPADSATKAHNTNRSYADAYNQVNAVRYQQEYLDATATNVTTASATASLPVMVSDEKLATAILNNTSETTVSQLESCAMIYPNGKFRWEIPESGIRKNQINQCVAEISLIDANTNTILATTTVAAGDAIKCNIDSFPESGMNEMAVNNTELPADVAPTLEDVEAVMNQEQKQNAGFKIAAGAIIAGVAGNLLSKKEAGSTKMFGTGKDQLIGTAAGVAAGAGIMAASSYSGKVAGDTIKSTAVNAASGMVVGNMLAGASGDSGILVFQKCTLSEALPEVTGEDGKKLYSAFSKDEYDCIPGKVSEKSEDSVPVADSTDIYVMNERGVAKKCTLDTTSGETRYKCNETVNLIDVQLKHSQRGTMAFNDIFSKTNIKDTERILLTRYVPVDQNNPDILKKDGGNIVLDNSYFEISSAYKAGNTQHVFMVLKNHVRTKLSGYKTSEIDEVKKATEYIYVLRNSNGTVGTQLKTAPEQTYFTPTSGSAEDGGLIDLSNQARTKGTLVGTAAGGAMGGFAGYQGAKSEITDRWTAAVREYEDSLSNFVCMTGNRYLSKYNDYAEIPALKSE